jgi:hypothetical protein
MLPSKDQLTICFAHVAYRLRERFLALATGIESFEVRDGAALEQRIGEADVLVISGLWRNDLLPRAKRLRFIQSIGAGTDQFSCDALRQHGVRLASARGVNARAVSEHVMALMLALARRLPEARDNQAKRVWRGISATSRSERTSRRQDAADRRPRTDRRPARAARQGVRQARDWHPPRPARRCRARGCARGGAQSDLWRRQDTARLGAKIRHCRPAMACGHGERPFRFCHARAGRCARHHTFRVLRRPHRGDLCRTQSRQAAPRAVSIVSCIPTRRSGPRKAEFMGGHGSGWTAARSVAKKMRTLAGDPSPRSTSVVDRYCKFWSSLQKGEDAENTPSTGSCGRV